MSRAARTYSLALMPVLLALLICLAPTAHSCLRSPPRFDCNSNGVDDAVDIALGTSGDANANGVPDECEQGSRTGSGSELRHHH